jgi:hypothetical protein
MLTPLCNCPVSCKRQSQHNGQAEACSFELKQGLQHLRCFLLMRSKQGHSLESKMCTSCMHDVQCSAWARESKSSEANVLSKTVAPTEDVQKPFVVETAGALQDAVNQGRTHIEIRQHLDLTTTPSWPSWYSFGRMKLKLQSTTQSIQVRSSRCCKWPIR